MVFKDVDQLKAFLTEDHNHPDLNPVRFINVDSLQMWVAVKKILVSLSDKTLLLSDFCETEDTTPNLKRLSSALKKTGETVCVFPLSEYLRVNPETAASVIKNILSMEYPFNDKYKMRIYFPMYRISNVLQVIPNTDLRKQNSFLYLQTGEEQDYQLTVIQNSLNVHIGGNEIFGFKRYLQYWEQNPDKPLVLHTQNAIHFERNHFFDNVKVIVSPFDLCKDQIRDFPGALLEDLGDEEFWYSFAEKAYGGNSFDNVCGSCLNTSSISLDSFEAWSILTPFKRWVLWLWAKIKKRNEYLFECAANSNSVEDFITEIYTGLEKYLGTSDYPIKYKERISAIKAMKLMPQDTFWNLLAGLAPIDALACLTNLTDVERKKIFEILKGVPFAERSPYVVALKTVYPELAYYLDNDISVNSADLTQAQYNYFEEYKWLKVTDSITASFVDEVKTIASQKGESVFMLPPRNQLVSEAYDDHSLILFVDGMGIEYADYLAYLFSNLDREKYQFSMRAGFCTLPTITENNKDFMLDRQTIEPPVRELDEHKHANCVYPENVIKELEILKTVKDRALSALNGPVTRIIIASDHGTSRLAVRIRNTEYDSVLPKPEEASVYKYGRFCDHISPNNKYGYAVCSEGKLIFADYSRFVQHGAPIDEIHGGASLEEWIVPVAVLEKTADLSAAEKVELELVTKEVKPQIGTGMITVRFKISGRVRSNVSVQIKGQKYPCKMDGKEYYFDYVAAGKEDSVIAQVIDGIILGKLEIKIVQGIMKNKKFDI